MFISKTENIPSNKGNRSLEQVVCKVIAFNSAAYESESQHSQVSLVK
jgi:hypothetical protein